MKEFLFEWMPGIWILGGLWLWCHSHGRISAIEKKFADMATLVLDAPSWDEARMLLKDYVTPPIDASTEDAETI